MSWVGCVGVLACAGAEEAGVVVRQTIVRAPMAKVVEAALQNGDDAALAKVVREWVTQGSAQVVSELEVSDSPPWIARKARTGQEVEVVADYDQDTENGKVVPSVMEMRFIGTSMEAHVKEVRTIGGKDVVDAAWETCFTPRGLDMVRWPAWWPTVKEAKVNWFSHPDHYEQVVKAIVRTTAGREQVVGIMRRADEVVAEKEKPAGEETLDVILVKAEPRGKVIAAVPKKAPVPVPGARVTVLAYSLHDMEALALLGKTGRIADAALLEELQKRTTEGKARLRCFTAVSTLRGTSAELKTVRQQNRPEEMPTIPSAWRTRPSGTQLQVELSSGNEVNFSFEHHPAPARMVEWRCALDSPELVLWQPQFFVHALETKVTFDEKGVALLGAMRTPECHAGAKGMTPGETMVVMAKMDGALQDSKPDAADAAAPGKATPIDPYAPKGIVPKTEPESPAGISPMVELDVVIFEIPPGEAVAWQAHVGPLADGQRFENLMARAKKGTDVKLAGHVTVAGLPNSRAIVKAIEEVKWVSEVDAPRFPGRYRPTGIETYDLGTKAELSVSVGTSQDRIDLGALVIGVNYGIKHDLMPPRQIDYQEAVALSEKKSSFRESAAPKFFDVSWYTGTVVRPGNASFMGYKTLLVEETDVGERRERVLVGFVRGRMGKGGAE